MIQRVLSHIRLTELTCFGLILFMGVFLGALIWVFRKGSTDFYTSMESIPFNEGEIHVK